ncbi:hypothetical protein A2U01_0038497, partial [Trifolium medium]|nr:hypothetical protein [Trifolium medium]
MKTTITVADDEEEPEVPIRRKKSASGVETHAPSKEKKDQTSGSHEEKKDRKRKDKKKEKSQHTEETGDKSESKKAKKHKKKKLKSSEDKTAPTPSVQPSIEIETEKEDMPPGTVLQGLQQETQEQNIDDSHQQGINQNLESANSCMGDDNAK